MATINFTDGSVTIVIQANGGLRIDSPQFHTFIDRLYAVNSLMAITTFDVNELDSPGMPYDYILDLVDERELDQSIDKTDQGWVVRPDNSSYFSLAELLANNQLRTAVQDLIDAFDVIQIDVDF